MFNTEFFITSLIVVLIPGTGVIYTISTGLFSGWRAGIFAALGCTCGIVPHLLASTLGLAAVLHMSAITFQVIKFIGVAYLLYLAWCMWRETGLLQINNSNQSDAYLKIAARGVLINILNPKLSLFFLAFLPQFISGDVDSPLQQMLVLSATFMLMTLLVFIVYGVCASAVRTRVINSKNIQRWAQRSFAAVFALLGLKLATAER
jgi:threonine/homoserine/homoserine lactone efflux protein